MKKCAHCRYSIGMHGGGLWCQKHERRAVRACGYFERAPGADDDASPAAPDALGAHDAD